VNPKSPARASPERIANPLGRIPYEDKIQPIKAKNSNKSGKQNFLNLEGLFPFLEERSYEASDERRDV
jgi:hypothetical protein